MVKAAIPAEGAVGRYEILLRAAARAAAKNGVPPMMHTESGKNAVQAVELCIRAGMVPEKIVVCHMDRQAKDFTPHEAVARLGVYLDYDTVGRFKYHSDAEEVTLLQHMMLWSNRILLALDTTAARLDAYDGKITRIAQSPDSDGFNGELDEPGEPCVWGDKIIVSCFDLVVDDEKINTAHEMPATMAMLDVEP